ncbi:hypothetical protein M3Y97_00343700 [Aphelenchoides bicaudatus]|nr:hypothetical protein M3Y97_00343700 [Aphelenchoides bicaudatus]
MALQGEDREDFVDILRSQLVSCVVLDGINGISEQLLIGRLLTEWSLDIREVYAKLSVQNVEDLLAIYGKKFCMRDGMIYLSNLLGDKSGIREATDLIRNSNAAKQQSQSTPQQRKFTGFSSHPFSNDRPVRQYSKSIITTYDFAPISQTSQQKSKPPRVLAPGEKESFTKVNAVFMDSTPRSKVLGQSYPNLSVKRPQVGNCQGFKLSKSFVLNHLSKKVAKSGNTPDWDAVEVAVDAILGDNFSDGSL